MSEEQVARKLSELKERVESLPPDAASEIESLKERIVELETRLEEELSAWDHVQLARHEQRPYSLDYIQRIFSSFRELHGDRKYSDDPAIVGGMALLDGRPVMVIGQQKGRNTRERLFRNYGMPNPEGYRKAQRLMLLAEKFGRPIFCFIDTPGAYPGMGAEERGQAQAIAHNLIVMASLKVPIIVTILGEGGSGGALAIGVGDRVLMMEHATYSVISPESCSAILWKDQDHAREAAENLRLTSEYLLRFSVVDEIIPEPGEGAHSDWEGAAATLKDFLLRHVDTLQRMSSEQRLAARFERFRRIGQYLKTE